MSTPSRSTTRRPGRSALVAPAPNLLPVIGSVCTGYGGLDLGVLAALGGGRIARCRSGTAVTGERAA